MNAKGPSCVQVLRWNLIRRRLSQSTCCSLAHEKARGSKGLKINNERGRDNSIKTIYWYLQLENLNGPSSSYSFVDDVMEKDSSMSLAGHLEAKTNLNELICSPVAK